MSIKLSRKHGANPSLMQCFFCGEAVGVALLGQLRGDVEAPRAGVYDREPCTRCRTLMLQGVFLIQVRDGETGANPYRTGPVVCVKEEAVSRIINTPALLAEILRKRVAFIEVSVWQSLGLPAPDAGTP